MSFADISPDTNRLIGHTKQVLSGKRMIFATYIYLLTALCIELELTKVGFNFGNLIALSGMVLGGLIAFFEIRRSKLKTRIFPHEYMYLVYILVCALSSFWSVDKFESFTQSIFLLIMIVSVLQLSSVDAKILERIIVIICLVVATASILTIFFVPSIAYQVNSISTAPELKGIMNHQLRLGVLCCIGLGVQIVSWLDGRPVFKSPYIFVYSLFMLLLCMYLARARLYTAYFFLCMAITILSGKYPLRRKIVIYSLIFTITLCYIYSAEIVLYLTDVGVDTTLTNRTLIWERTSKLIEYGPINGYGYASFGSPRFDWIFPSYRPLHPHNAFLAVRFETGVIGVACLALLIYFHFRSVMNNSSRLKIYSVPAFLMLFTFFGSLTGINYGGKVSFLFCVAMLFISVDSRARPLNAESR